MKYYVLCWGKYVAVLTSTGILCCGRMLCTHLQIKADSVRGCKICENHKDSLRGFSGSEANFKPSTCLMKGALFCVDWVEKHVVLLILGRMGVDRHAILYCRCALQVTCSISMRVITYLLNLLSKCSIYMQAVGHPQYGQQTAGRL